MPRRSAGLLPYRRTAAGIEVFLVHPGGPLWARKDNGVWSIAKGEYSGEDPLAAAQREFTEETGFVLPNPVFLPLGEVKQAGGKIVMAWAVEADLDPEAIQSMSCEIEWPPRSGRRLTIPEVDRAGWFGPELAQQKLLPAQLPFLARLRELLAGAA